MKKIIEADKKNIGHVIYDIWDTAPKILFIHQFNIHEKHRGQGYFKQLINEAKQIAHESNIFFIALCVGSSEIDEKWLRKLYERYGFVESGGLMKLDLM
jgi:GNAT superfamily N-acetyltransferase